MNNHNNNNNNEINFGKLYGLEFSGEGNTPKTLADHQLLVRTAYQIYCNAIERRGDIQGTLQRYTLVCNNADEAGFRVIHDPEGSSPRNQIYLIERGLSENEYDQQ